MSICSTLDAYIFACFEVLHWSACIKELQQKQVYKKTDLKIFLNAVIFWNGQFNFDNFNILLTFC